MGEARAPSTRPERPRATFRGHALTALGGRSGVERSVGQLHDGDIRMPAQLLRYGDDPAVHVSAVGKQLLDGGALDAESLRHAEVLVEDHDDDGVVVGITDGAEVAPT